MRKTSLSIAAVACAAAIFSVSVRGASAECMIGEDFDFGGQTGTVQNGDLVKFFSKDKMGLTGEANAKRQFNDASWAGKVSAVDVKGKCTAVLYGPWGHANFTKATPSLDTQFNDKATGIGCYCK